jgi:hypothetical protein
MGDADRSDCKIKAARRVVRIMGSKRVLLQTLMSARSAKTVGFGVPSFVPKWRARHDFECVTFAFGGRVSRKALGCPSIENSASTIVGFAM